MSKVDFDWEETVRPRVQQIMRELGGFWPTVNVSNKEVKGRDLDGCKRYYSSIDLREISSALIEVADWLDRRAAAKGQP